MIDSSEICNTSALSLVVLSRSNLDPTVSGDVTDGGSQSPPQISCGQQSKIECPGSRLATDDLAYFVCCW